MIKKPNQKNIESIKDHIENTADFLIKGYSIKELAFLDGITTDAVKKSGKYIPVRIDGTLNRHRYEKGLWKKPYRILYVRVDEIKYIFKKRNGKDI